MPSSLVHIKSILYKHGHILGFVCITVFLFLHFNYNLFQTANPEWLATFGHDSESVIIGRIAASRSQGIASHGGVLGHYAETGSKVAPELDYQFHIYAGAAKPKGWVPYVPQIGLQGIIYSLIDKFFSPKPWNFMFLLGCTAFFNSLVIGSFILWVGSEIGFSGLIGLLLGTFYSSWLAVYGTNLYFVFGTFFLPLVTSCWCFRYLHQHKNAHLMPLMGLIFGACFIRWACGYEYLTTIAMASWVPVVFYAWRDQWKLKYFVKISALLAGTSIAAFLFAFILNIILVSFADGAGLYEAFTSVLSHAEIRLGTPLLNDQFIDPTLMVHPDSLKIKIWQVIDLYMRGYIYGPEGTRFFINWPPTFGDAVLLAIASGLFVLITKRKDKSETSRTMVALTLAMGAGYLATQSWYVMAWQHSVDHPHLNFIMWYVPFMLLLYALVGEVLLGSLIRRYTPSLAISTTPGKKNKKTSKSYRRKSA